MTAYGNATDFRSYHTNRGRTISGSWHDADVNKALLVASEWLDNNFGNLFYGFPTGGYTQARLWPRTSAMTNTYPCYVFEDDEIPTSVINATYEAAYRELSTPSSLTVDFTPSKHKSVRVEGAVAVEYAGISQASEIQTRITIIDQMLAPLLNPNADGSSSILSGSIFRA